jgi:rare lipoprotein A
MRGALSLVLLGLGLGLLPSCEPEAPPPVYPAPVVLVAPPVAGAPPAPVVATPYQTGLATWYGAALAGHKTASGERFDPRGMTAAHRTLPLGTWVVVRRPDTGQTVRVRINDRGPFGDDRRVIDLSRAAADALGVTAMGVAPVEVYVEGASSAR